MFTGAGVTVMTGLIANVEGAIAAGAGMGFQSGVGRQEMQCLYHINTHPNTYT